MVRVTEQFLHCGLRKCRHSKSPVYRWYPQLARGRFVYDTYRTVEATWSHHMFITHRPTVSLQLHNFDFFRTCRKSSFCTVVWQLARFQLTRYIARFLGDSRASCIFNRSKDMVCWKMYNFLGPPCICEYTLLIMPSAIIHATQYTELKLVSYKMVKCKKNIPFKLPH